MSAKTRRNHREWAKRGRHRPGGLPTPKQQARALRRFRVVGHRAVQPSRRAQKGA